MGELKQDIEACLATFWDQTAIEMGDPSSTEEWGAPLDSLTCLDALVEIDKLVKRKVPTEVVLQKGGYDSREQFIEQFTTKILKYLEEHPDA